MTQQEALDILKTGANVFLTGEPGSGKTHTVRAYVQYLRAAKVRAAVTASTGIAATHLGGMTLHSWSGIGIARELSAYDVDRIAGREQVARRIRKTAVLIIDEISMLDGRVLAGVDRICREVKQEDAAFGGMQTVLVGDFFQLPPVARQGEAPAQFAFASAAWAALQPLICYLTEQHRQEDAAFLDLLGALRRNAAGAAHCALLDGRCQEPGAQAGRLPRLYSHNADVDKINAAELEKLDGPATVFQMKTGGRGTLVEQLKRGCLSPERLALKRGAAVMFTKNSPAGSFVNGTLGTVADFDRESRLPVVETKAGRSIRAAPMEWVVEDGGRVLARIAQIPLRLAWAMTVHKSQGMSLDAAFVDLRQAFEAGQGYVALSRVRTLAGLFLAGYNQQALRVHPEVLAQDAAFRQLSAEAAAAFAKLPRRELAGMQRNFIRAAGGRLPRRSAGPRAEEAEKPFSVASLRENYPNAYRSWQAADDALLAERYRAGDSVRELAERFGRKPGAIRARLLKAGLVKG